MRLKLDSNSRPVLANGNPVFVTGDGREVPVNVADLMARVEKAEAATAAEQIGRAFDKSKYIADDLLLPPDMVHARFGDAFRMEDGRPVAYENGVRVLSRTRIGEPADVDEALEYFVSKHPHRDIFVRPPELKTTRKPNGNGSGSHGKPTLPRSDFERMRPAQQMAHIKAGGTIHD